MMNAAFRSKAIFTGSAARVLLLGSLSLGTMATTLVMPTLLSQRSGMALAQSEDGFTRYVRAAFEIEKQRRQMMRQVKESTGGNVPGNVCSNLGQVGESVRGQVQGVCGEFARFAGAAVKKHGLSKDEFNKYQSQMGNPDTMKAVNAKIQELGLK
jgi:hypothetical protein